MGITIRTYDELMQLKTFDERYEYLKLNGKVSETTFGHDRFINQRFYNSTMWSNIRTKIIVRDTGCDLGLDGYEVYNNIIVHHMNPIFIDDILNITDNLINPNYLICTCLNTHNAIHYGTQPPNIINERRRGDTCLWIK